jgi:GNAT superfamily N-acetyltransferase
MTLTVRLAVLADAQSIGATLANIDDYPHWRAAGAEALAATARDSLLANSPDRSIYVGLIDSDIVGYAAVYWLNPLFGPREGYLSELFIRSSASGLGVGSALLERVKAEAQKQLCARLTLINLKDRESYLRGFYASRGWEEKPNTVRFVYPLTQD